MVQVCRPADISLNVNIIPSPASDVILRRVLDVQDVLLTWMRRPAESNLLAVPKFWHREISPLTLVPVPAERG
jgi:hypothetical protein